MKYYTWVSEVTACLPVVQSYIYQYVSQVQTVSFLISLHFCIQEVTCTVNCVNIF
jgi:hypothetical protein